MTLDVPEIPKDQIDVRVTGDTIPITAEQKTERADNGSNWLRRERSWSGFRRQLELHEPVLADRTSPRSENGVLTANLPKAHPVTEAKVTVE
jgi:HSP20 family protein